MKASLPSIALRRPVTVLMVSVTLLGLGVIAWSRLPIEFLPRIDFPFMICAIPYLGATPEQVENEVAIPAEGEFRTVSQLREIRSVSNTNGCTVRLLFDWEADMALAAAEVRDRMERLKLRLPSSVERMQLLHWSSDSLPVMFLFLSSEGDYEDLSYRAQTQIKSRLLRLKGVADVEVLGLPGRDVLIQFDQALLRSRNLSLYQVVGLLQASSLNVSVGKLTDGAMRYYVRVLDEVTEPEQFGSLVVGPKALRLDQVAEVSYRARELESGHSIDGKTGVVLLVRKEAEANTVATCRAVRAELDRLQKEPLFQDVTVFTFFDQSEVIMSALGSLLQAGKYGGALAVAVLFLFLARLRPTFLVAASIPTSLVVALVYMFFAGMTLNLVTMISLIVALGMLVDNSIVVIENIYRYNQLGFDPRESARRGASEVGLAITAATLTTLVVFVPILYLESGEMASYFKQFAAPMSVSLAASLGIALTIIPLAASRMSELNPASKQERQSRPGRFLHRLTEDWLEAWLRLRARTRPLRRLIECYRQCLAWSLRWRLAVVAAVTFLALVTIAVPFREVGQVRPPEPDRREVVIEFEFDPNFNLAMVKDIVDKFQTRIDRKREELGIKNVFASYSVGQANLNLFLLQPDDLSAGLTLPYTTQEVRDILWQSFPERLPGVEVKFQVAHAAETEMGLAIRLRGDDSEVLAEYAEEFKKTLARYVPELTDVTTEQERARQEIQLGVDEPRSAEIGVTPLVIARTVDFALRGAQLQYLKKGEREVPVWAQFREEDRKTRANLDNVAVLGSRNTLVPLNNLVTLQKARSPRSIHRINGKNVTTVTAATRSKDLSKVIEDVKGVIALFAMPPGYSIELGETARELETDMTNFLTAMLLSCILIYLVMGALFESYVLPLSILWSVPLAFIGVWWLLYLTGTSIDTITLIGMILMTGVVVNNAIVIVDHINQLRRQGMERHKAILQAGCDRFRPVMMTALTTILGCLPIALGGTIGSEVNFSSLGRAFIGGLTSGTVLTLIVVPVMYSLIDDLRTWFLRYFADLASLRPGYY